MDFYKNTGIKKKVIEELKIIAEKCNIEKIILFGSRARGDFKERSDIDLAVLGEETDKFSILADEETSTLLKYDIVDLNKPVQEELLESIKKEGIVLYEKV